MKEDERKDAYRLNSANLHTPPNPRSLPPVNGGEGKPFHNRREWMKQGLSLPPFRGEGGAKRRKGAASTEREHLFC